LQGAALKLPLRSAAAPLPPPLGGVYHSVSCSPSSLCSASSLPLVLGTK
jgi:hypothetical protein